MAHLKVYDEHKNRGLLVSAFEKFMTLGDFIFDDVEDLATVGEAIQEHGIYKLDQSGTPISYAVDSKVAFDALYRLVLRWEDQQETQKYPLSTDTREGFASIGGDDYGWPASAVPDMGLAQPKRPPQMSSLNHLLNKDFPISHGLLALQIESEGIYVYDNFSEGFWPRGPDSTEAHDALLVLSIDLYSQKRGGNPRYEESPEEDPTYSYGWPKGKVPKFNQVGDGSWVEQFHLLKSKGTLFKDNLYTAGRILALQKGKPGGIQTAIEREGIYGFDSVGRVKHFSAQAAEVKVVELALAAYATMLAQGIQPDFSKLDHDSLSRFGWPRNRLPDFVSIEAEPLAEPVIAGAGTLAVVTPSETEAVTVLQPQALSLAKRTASANANKANDTIVAALMAFIRGDLSPNHHPDYSSQDTLIALFADKLIPCYGMSERSLKAKFSAANKLRPELGLAPHKPEK